MKNKQELTKAEVASPVLSPHGHQTQQCISSHCHSTTAIQASYTVSLFSLSSGIFFSYCLQDHEKIQSNKYVSPLTRALCSFKDRHFFILLTVALHHFWF